MARKLLPRVARFVPEAELSAFSLERFLADRRAPERIVLCPEGRNVDDDVRFLEEARRRALWTGPGGELAAAISGLRGSHDERGGPARAGRRSTTALLLEGDVTPERARSAAASGAPRHWIVERVQSVRLAAPVIEELRRLGIRWSVLEPVELVAVAASPALARNRSRWRALVAARVPVWTGSPRRKEKKGTDSSSGEAKFRKARVRGPRTGPVRALR